MLSLVRIAGVFAALVALLSIVVPLLKKEPQLRQYVSGRNNTVLFLTTEHHGCSNVHLATAQALLEQHPDIEIHWGSFERLANKFPRLSSLAKRRQPDAKDIVFHTLKGVDYVGAVTKGGLGGFDENGTAAVVSPPGVAGVKQLVENLQHFIAPWEAEEHFEIYRACGELIDEIDPAVVVLDTIFGPGIEATRSRNRLHAFITPNMVIDNFIGEQPWGGMLWRYPGIGSGHPYPVPWSLVPANIYINLLLIRSTLSMPLVAVKKAYLEARGVPEPINFWSMHRPDAPWLTQTMPGASVPVEYIPRNVTCTGPIVFSPAAAAEQDPELVSWLGKRPTVLINIGSANYWSIPQTRQMVAALADVLDKTDVQILWKYKPLEEIEWDWEGALRPLFGDDRIRIEVGWLSIDPPALLQSGNIAAFVTHGGANAYHEGLEAGVPMIVLPLWVDLYNYAQLAEETGIGFWGCRRSAPDWSSECLSEAIVRVAGNSPESLAMKAKSKELSDKAREAPGREVAASIVAGLARPGK